MCGITGLYAIKSDRSRAELHAIAQAMTGAIRHRGPDHGDVWQDETVPLALGFRRLAILDLSAEGQQPMRSSSDRYVIVYNGEIYNYLDLRKTLEAAGVTFRGRSDTEVFLAAVEHWGLNQSLQKINGMFVLALWDRQARMLHFARDRLGKKPLYIGWAGNTLVFGSELKALRAHPDFKPQINPEALNLYLRYGYVSAPFCIYENVWSLPAGFRLDLETEKLQAGENLRRLMKPYWHHQRVLQESHMRMRDDASDEEVISEFEELLSSCVQERLISDVPLGAFLSGGIDSSTIVALMQKMSSLPVRSYSIGFHEAGFDEAGHAKKIAQHLGTQHREHYVSAQDALDVVPMLPDIYDEPFADSSAVPTYLVSKFARREVTVALSGDGGDEMLGGYNRHFQGPKIWAAMRMIPGAARGAMAQAIENIPPSRWDSWMPQRPQMGSAMHKLASIITLDTQEQVYGRMLALWEEAPMMHSYTPQTLFRDPEFQPPAGLSFAEKMMYWDALTYLPNDILTKVDRASMAVSLEARAPLLDKRIYEYAWSLPPRFKIRNGKGKWLLRQVLKRHVPPALFERPKQGFSVPTGAWLRGPLKDWAENLLDEKSLSNQGILNPAPIRAAWQAHLQGHGNHAERLWIILMFQAWRARWL